MDLRSWRPRLARLALPCLAASLGWASGGCASSPEVKRASTQMTQALAALDGAKEDFKQALLAEIDATRDQVGRAMVARAVRARIEEAAAGLEASGNLIAISDEIDAVARSVSQLAGQIKAVKVSPEPTRAEVDEALRAALDGRVTALDRAIALLASTPAAAELQRERAVVESWRRGTTVRDELETLVRLAGLRAYVEGRLLAEFETHVRVLRMVQAAADRWIQTDVVVSGAQVAGVVKDAQPLLDGFDK